MAVESKLVHSVNEPVVSIECLEQPERVMILTTSSGLEIYDVVENKIRFKKEIVKPAMSVRTPDTDKGRYFVGTTNGSVLSVDMQHLEATETQIKLTKPFAMYRRDINSFIVVDSKVIPPLLVNVKENAVSELQCELKFPLRAAGFLSKSELLVTVDIPGFICVWDKNGVRTFRQMMIDGSATNIAVSPSEQSWLAFGQSQSVFIHDCAKRTHREISIPGLKPIEPRIVPRISSIVFSNDETGLIVGSEDGQISIVNVDNGSIIDQKTIHSPGKVIIRHLFDKSVFYSGGSDGKVFRHRY